MLFFFNDTATTEIYTLSLHDALPISPRTNAYRSAMGAGCPDTAACDANYYGFFNQVHYGAYLLKRYTQPAGTDRKSTRLNSSHANISYAVFCLKKKKTK